MVIPDTGFSGIDHLCLQEAEIYEENKLTSVTDTVRVHVNCFTILRQTFTFDLSTPIELVKTQYLMVCSILDSIQS